MIYGSWGASIVRIHRGANGHYQVVTTSTSPMRRRRCPYGPTRCEMTGPTFVGEQLIISV